MSKHEFKNPLHRIKTYKVEWFVMFAAVVGFMVVTNILNQVVFWAGMPPLLFLLYEMCRSIKSANTRKSEEKLKIRDTHNLANQCKEELEIIDDALEEYPDDNRVYTAMTHLSGNIRLFISLYRRHIDENAVRAVASTEILIARAILP